VSITHPKPILVPYRNPVKVQPYLDALAQVGLLPHPHLTSGPARLDGINGLLLMGGTDVNPKRYNETAWPETDEPDDERDAIELELLDQAIERDLPVLAICRGLQLLNVYHGGSLVQHLASPRHDPELDDKAQPAHEVAIEPQTLLHRSLNLDRVQVNSRHHQSIAKLGSDLQICARSTADNVIEGLERPDKQYVLAVQWHPEDQIRAQPEQLRLFASLARAASRV
jgi:putative glutamine amidotransferase